MHEPVLCHFMATFTAGSAISRLGGIEMRNGIGRREAVTGNLWIYISRQAAQYMLILTHSFCTHSAQLSSALGTDIRKTTTMTKSLAILASFAVAAWANPVPDPEPQLSLPPLIPKIPGVTEALTENAPPLPVLQVPTPPLDSPPFVGSELKPKKIGYFWTGAGDNEHAGMLVLFVTSRLC